MKSINLFNQSKGTNLAPAKMFRLATLMALALILLLGLSSLTVLAQEPGDFEVIKTVSQEEGARGVTVTFIIDVQRNGGTSDAVQGVDQLPPELDFIGFGVVDGGVQPAYITQTGQLTFDMIIPLGEAKRLEYQARLRHDAECDRELINRVQLTGSNQTAEARLRVICSDLGDAPDSDNHFGLDMFTPAGAKAGYPTVYDPPGGTPTGPRHHRADLMYLGKQVSFEAQADVGPDMDLTNNIIPPFNLPDMDAWDDGWLNRDRLDFVDCEPATLEFELFLDPMTVQTIDEAFINVWFDGNRNGSWGDVNLCNQEDVPEHIVIDYFVNVVALGPGSHIMSVTTTVPVFNPGPARPTWVRVTLSEQPSVKTGSAGGLFFGDGQGVFSTLVDPMTGHEVPGFWMGETEDYFYLPPSPQPLPGLEISKVVGKPIANFGDELIYMVTVTNTHSFSIPVTIFDPIPSGTTFSGFFNSTLPGGGYDPAANAVFWHGELPPNQPVMLEFGVKVTGCDTFGFNVVNRAWAVEPGFPPLEAMASTLINDCVIPPPPRKIRVDKFAPPDVPPGGDIEFTLVAHSRLSNTVQLEVVDPLPFNVWVDPGTLPPGVSFIPPNLINWQTPIGQNETISMTFTARVNDWACREPEIRNQAHWWTDIPGLDGHTNPTWTKVICSDLGDAPDSAFNHHGIPNTAYGIYSGTTLITPTVAGRYPTVWEGPGAPPGEPSGPIHFDAGKVWLGEDVSFELEADIGPDQDGVNNILNDGKDNANNDHFDDGWLNRDVPLPDCRESTLHVLVTKGAPYINEMFLNVWFDGNRDGDWEDVKFCDDQRVAFEWIAQNFVIDMSAWPPGTTHDIVVPTFLIMNDGPIDPGWMRFTLSESPPPPNPATGLADGRGPDFDMGYWLGETEDYITQGYEPGGEPGTLDIDKTASVTSATIGDVYTYSVVISHAGGTGPAYAEMLDELPLQVMLAGPPVVELLYGNAVPLAAFFDSGVGPNGAVGWGGDLWPDSAIQVDFQVELVHCPMQGDDIYNKAKLSSPGIPDIFGDATVQGNCMPPEPPNITLTKRIVTDLDELRDEWTTVPGETVMYFLVLSSTETVTRFVTVEDPLHPGTIAIAAGASSGVAHIVDAGHAVVWEGLLGPAKPRVEIEILVKLREVECGQEIRNMAHWSTQFFPGGPSNETVLRLACHDLGDAPDSSNHFPGVGMNAYPGTPASFPTVFTGTGVLTAARGPLHLRPQPLHLGPRVSFEIEADIGLDLDGVNNIEPPPDRANLDEADDGVELDKLNFVDCKPYRFPVWVSIEPHVIPALGQGGAFLNVWLDGNRDGDWADAFDCPPDPDTGFSDAKEHIVIDQRVDVAALGPGLHQIFVETTSLVHWPDDLRNKPAWLRVTLSDEKSAKPFGAYGDGRGYSDHPFAWGETEDYLLRGPDEPREPDPTVEKRGFLYPFFEFEPGQPDQGARVWFLEWPVHYRNTGGAAANNVKITDTFDDRQELAHQASYPHITPVESGNTLTYNRPWPLHPGEEGGIFIVTRIPFTTAPGTVLTNTVTITGSGDSHPGNNTSVVTQTVPLLPPLITYPTPGTTCTDTFTITGRVQIPGAEVQVFIDGDPTPVFTDTADAQGQWSGQVTLPDGAHDIQAQAIHNGFMSPLSPPVMVIVDTSLVWSPLSLRFTTIDEHGNPHTIIPKDENGRTDPDGWFVFLRPGKTYTVTVYICCDDPNASVTLAIPGGQVVNLTDPDGDKWYEATFTMPDEGSLQLITDWSITLCVTCYNIQYCSSGEVLIDPEGVVFDVAQGIDSGLLENSIVACYEASTSLDTGETTFNLWPAENFSQINPQTTATDGYFSFFTPAGTFQLDVTRDSYQPYRSPDIIVLTETVHYNVPLTKIITETADYTVTINAAGFSPSVLTVEPGAVVKWLNVDTLGGLHTTFSITPTALITPNARMAALDNTDGWDSGLLNAGANYKRQLNAAGSYTYQDGENNAYTGLIVVQAKNSIYLPLILKNQ